MLLEKARQYATDCINCNEITTFEVKNTVRMVFRGP